MQVLHLRTSQDISRSKAGPLRLVGAGPGRSEWTQAPGPLTPRMPLAERGLGWPCSSRPTWMSWCGGTRPCRGSREVYRQNCNRAKRAPELDPVRRHTSSYIDQGFPQPGCTLGTFHSTSSCATATGGPLPCTPYHSHLIPALRSQAEA